jgi:hypothetical protein
MHQDHVASRRSQFEDLERYPIDFFDTLMKARDPRFRIARRVQIPEVWVPFQRFAELRCSSLWRRWILAKPAVHQTMRSAENVHAAAAWLDVVQHGVYFHAGGGRQAAGVIAIDVPACARYIPLTPDRELQEEGAPIARLLPGLALQHLIDRLERTLGADRAENRIGLQVLQVFGPRRRPSGPIVAMDSGFGQRGPDDIAHRGGVSGREGSGNADPSIGPKVFQYARLPVRHRGSRPER